MRKVTRNTKGFALVELLIIIVVLVAVGGVGAFAYHQSHKTKKATTSSTSSKTSTNKNTTTDPYAGWKSASLTYEKASFKYPDTWQLKSTPQTEAETGGTATPGADNVTLTSPSGLLVTISTGQAGIGSSDGLETILSGAKPISTLGGDYYLDFYHNRASSSSTTDAQGACVGIQATATGMPYVASKNIKLANVEGSTAAAPANLVCVQYAEVQGQLPLKPVSTFENDASFNDAKLIMESLAY
ncbi:hypothetical protein [Streptomyces sp. NPDC048341]|uniref:hypothetical protein n=1 Tax=Streptomyces sp. NPDC048341 TaxID=3154620 RepID=UPI0034294445